jgi:NADPH:quinone reductase-like Zn-dependent oxidoreductase
LVISAVGTPVVPIDLVDFYRNESRLLGINSGNVGVVESGSRLTEMATYFESGAFRPLPISRTYGLDESQGRVPWGGERTPGRIVINP